MSITLDATLKTAQDGDSHRPIVDLVTSPMEAAIPFRGSNFNTGDITESNRDLIVTSSGRLANVYLLDGDLYYYYSNTDTNQWQTPVYIGTGLGDILSASVCELTNGHLGVILVKANYDLGYMIISQTGSIETAYAAISTGNSWVGGVSVITLANNTYLLICADGDAEPPGDSDNYYLQKRTSSNFTSWSAASDISLPGLSVPHYKNNPHLLQITSGRIYLHFDYLTSLTNDIEVRNVYYVISDDNGSSWSVPAAVTSHGEIGKMATNPVAGEKEDGNIIVVYQEENNTLHYHNMDGTGDLDWVGNALAYDPAQQLIIATNHDEWFTTPCVMAIDTGTNQFIKYWDDSTSPLFTGDFKTMFNQNGGCKYPFYLFSHSENDNHGDSRHAIEVLNYVEDSITKYQTGINFNIGRIGSYGHDWWDGITPFVRLVSDTDRRLYIGYKRTDYAIHGPPAFLLGYIDLDEVADPISGMYTWHEVAYISYGPSDSWGINSLWWEESIQRFVLLHNSQDRDTGNPTDYGGVWFIDDDGVLTDVWSHGDNAGLPKGGAYRGVWRQGNEIKGNIWFTFEYLAGYPDRRGLCRLNLDTNAFTYHEPTWFTCTGDCGLNDLEAIDGDRILMTCNAGDCDKSGVVILDTGTMEWTIYNNNTIPGMFWRSPTNCSRWRSDRVVVQYDVSTKTIYAAYGGHQNHAYDQYMGIIYFSEYGSYSILKYLTVTIPDGAPVYGEEASLSYYSFEYNPALTIDADGYAWFTWDHMDSTVENSLVWANTMSDKQVEDYLVDGSILQIEWEVDKPNKLTFSMSNGHLFDPLNYLSIWSIYFRAGRVLTLKLGERVGEADYLQAQGKYIVKETSLSYTKSYPIIRVVAEDSRSLWDDTHIIASEYFSDVSPKTVTESLLVDHGGLTGSDYDIPAYEESHNLYHQFVDMNLADALRLILDHFGYFGFMNVDGKYQPRRVRVAGSPDHIYTGAEIIEFTPDSKYATWLNRIIVTGMSNIFSEVLYELESVKTVTGSVGFWSGDEDLTVYYADDKQRTCRDPRLDITTSVSEFEIWGMKGGGSEEISSVDADEHYVVITIEIPDLTGMLIASVAALVGVGTACTFCDGYVTGWCGYCMLAITTLLNLVLMILGAVASYAYDIWARPVGHERATFQALADDEEFQQQLNGKIIAETIDDPFCYMISRCQLVADFELSVVEAQRRRLAFKKTGHLQDEIGDILRISHPYSGEDIELLVTGLKRSVKIGGEIADTIEGWRLS